MKKILLEDRIKGGVDSFDVFEFNFFDILEAGWDPDQPMGLQIQKDYKAPKYTGSHIKKNARADKRDMFQAALEKDKASPEVIRASMNIYDKTEKLKSRAGRPPTGNKTNKYMLGIYSRKGIPKGTKKTPSITVGGAVKKKFVSMDQLPDTRDSED